MNSTTILSQYVHEFSPLWSVHTLEACIAMTKPNHSTYCPMYVYYVYVALSWQHDPSILQSQCQHKLKKMQPKPLLDSSTAKIYYTFRLSIEQTLQFAVEI